MHPALVAVTRNATVITLANDRIGSPSAECVGTNTKYSPGAALNSNRPWLIEEGFRQVEHSATLWRLKLRGLKKDNSQ